ncbi:MAG: hypothetical protein ACRC1H_13000, partial [Caldilineaceae bacterium]
LGRADPFDRLGVPASVDASGSPTREAALEASGLAGSDAQSIFSPLEQRLLLGLVESGAVPAAELRAKVQIVLEERRNYDPATTRAALESHAGTRALILDTTRLSASEAAVRIAAALSGWWPTLELTAP